jgi:hypothetical protein
MDVRKIVNLSDDCQILGGRFGGAGIDLSVLPAVKRCFGTVVMVFLKIFFDQMTDVTLANGEPLSKLTEMKGRLKRVLYCQKYLVAFSAQRFNSLVPSDLRFVRRCTLFS